MTKLWITLWFMLAAAAGIAFGVEIRLSDMEGKPTAYCKVVQEPNPLLLGHFGCVHRKFDEKTSGYVMEPIEYWLVKLGDKYALYFYRVKDGKGKAYKGWRKWYLEGDRINSGGNLEIFVKEGEVYYGWKSDRPTKMWRIE